MAREREVGNPLRRGNIVPAAGAPGRSGPFRAAVPLRGLAWGKKSPHTLSSVRPLHGHVMPGTLTRLLTARRPARAVGLFRIGVGLAVLARGLKTGRDLYLLGHDPSVVPARLYDWAPRLETLPEVLAFTVVWMLAWRRAHAWPSRAAECGCVVCDVDRPARRGSEFLGTPRVLHDAGAAAADDHRQRREPVTAMATR